MNNLEFSNGFDTMLNSYADVNTLALSEYEKSFFLTQALNQLVKSLYSSTDSSVTYECNEKTRRELEKLVTTITFSNSNSYSTDVLSRGKYNHSVFKLPKDCWYIVYEEVDLGDSVSCESIRVADVLPVAHDDYARVVKNPFRGPTSSRVLRLDKGGGEVELVSTTNNYKYTVRYIRQPKPIILEALPSDASVENGNLIETPCELPEELHWDILRLAVDLAIARESLYNKGK